MSAANNATFAAGGYPQHSQDHGGNSILPTSEAINYSIVGFGEEQTSFVPEEQQLNTHAFNQMPNYGFYQQYQQYASSNPAMDTTSLHPSTSRSPSSAHDHFSPSEFASQAAVYGDGFSDYGTPAFDHTYSESQFPPPMNIQDSTRGVAGQFNSPQRMDSQSSDFSHLTTVPSLPTQTSSSQHYAAGPFVSQPLSVSGEPQQFLPRQNSLEVPSQQFMGTTSQQHTLPASGSGSSDLAAFQRPRLVVTIDEYADESSTRSSSDHPGHRRASSKRSNTHLSPYPESDSSGEDEENIAHKQNGTPVQRNSEGAWVRESPSRQSGIEPDSRSAVNTNVIPTLDDLDEQRKRCEKNAEVQDWLSHSEVGSDAEGNGDMKTQRKKTKHRPRAKSTNDTPFNGNYTGGLDVNYHPFSNVAVPGPGLTINEPSEMDDDEDYEGESEPESPPASITPLDDSEGYFTIPSASNFTSVQPISNGDKNKASGGTDKDVAGITANLAIMRFRQRAKDTDNASVTATLGTRRNSESDIGSVLGVAGISKLLLNPPRQTERTPAARRMNSFIDSILPSRNNSSKLKRKNSHSNDNAETIGAANPPKEQQAAFATPKRIGSFGRSRSPRVDTNVPSAVHDVKSPKPVGTIKQIWRSRSRSDLSKTPNLGLAELWTKTGGPPMPTLASPAQNRTGSVAATVAAADDDSENDEEGLGPDELATLDLSVRTDMHIIPTVDGFRYQAHQLNPRLADFLQERITQEQVKRYKRLVDFKTKHSHNVAAHSCPTKALCLASGGQARVLPPRPGNKDPDNALVGFQIMRPGMTDDDLEVTSDGPMIAAQFPSGVPLPPVSRLPAEFECPLCFKIKKIYKPSDWTKHVHEDVQPFTCTFSGCNESKSFKRKADWVRHENERHRQLEYWTCNFQDCAHTCYRKDNFVQHLVREHKVPEPKIRTGRGGGSKSPMDLYPPAQSWQSQLGVAESVEDVWGLVEQCHHESSKQPKDEACKFCGNVCTSWKKLTVHLAKHMEQITMPVLPLVEQKRTTINFQNPSIRSQQAMPIGNMSATPLNDLPTFLCEEPADMDMEPSNMLSAPMMHTYPPPNLAIQAQMAAQTAAQTEYISTPTNHSGTSYPPPSLHTRSRGSSFNDQQGTTYPPPGMNSRSMNSSPAHFDHQPQMFFQQPGAMFMQEPIANAYLTPVSTAPASLGYSPEGSTHDLGRGYGYHQG